MNSQALNICSHANKRIRQRSYKVDDIDLIMNCGTRVDEETYFLKNKDIQHEIQIRKHQIQRLEHLRGTKVIIKEGTVVTIYRLSEKNQHKVRRYATYS